VVVATIDPFKGELELPTPRAMVRTLEYVRTEFDSKSDTQYEKGLPIMF
jgi:hypothetical protein